MELGDSDARLIAVDMHNPRQVESAIKEYARSAFSFDRRKLQVSSGNPLPQQVDVVVVGAGVVGLYAAHQLAKNNISYCVVDERDICGGIWSRYANAASQVNTSEGAYRLVEKEFRSNRDHSTTREILEDIARLAAGISENLYLKTGVAGIEKTAEAYRLQLSNGHAPIHIDSKGVILAINDRVGEPRLMAWENQTAFQGALRAFQI